MIYLLIFLITFGVTTLYVANGGSKLDKDDWIVICFMSFSISTVVSLLTIFFLYIGFRGIEEVKIPYDDIQKSGEFLVVNRTDTGEEIIVDTNRSPAILGEEKVVVYRIEILDDNKVTRLFKIRGDINIDKVIKENRPRMIRVEEKFIDGGK